MVPARLVMLADAATATGIGHWVRSTSLADELSTRGWHVRVIHRLDATARVRAETEERGWSSRTGDWTPETFDAELDSRGGVVLLDSYRVDADGIAQLRRPGWRTVLVDDLADRGPLDVDMVVNQNLGAEGFGYRLRDPATRMLLGPSYAMLRPQFAHQRPTGLQRASDLRGVATLLVMMGGTDATGVLTSVVRACLQALPDARVRAVAPESAVPALEALTGSERLDLIAPTPRIAEEMVRADAVISAGGTSVWELCATSRPFGVVVVADNQVDATRRLVRAEAAAHLATRPIDPQALVHEIVHFAADAAALTHRAGRAAALVDGLGCGRVADEVEALIGADRSPSVRCQ